MPVSRKPTRVTKETKTRGVFVSQTGSSKSGAMNKAIQSSIILSSRDLERIRVRAYYIWVRKGRPSNNALDNWVEAEKEFVKKPF